MVERGKKTNLDKIKYLKISRKSKIQYIILDLKCEPKQNKDQAKTK